jgi:hypothetical protein
MLVMTEISRRLFYLSYLVTYQAFISEKGIHRTFKIISPTTGNGINVSPGKAALPHIIGRKAHLYSFNSIQANGLSIRLTARQGGQSKGTVKNTAINREVVVKIISAAKT